MAIYKLKNGYYIETLDDGAHKMLRCPDDKPGEMGHGISADKSVSVDRFKEICNKWIAEREADAARPVYTPDTFDVSKAVPGDLVTQEVVDNFMNALPPASMSFLCAQLGEPYSEKKDPDTGRFRPTFLTFKKKRDEVWEYCGKCFRGETVERGEEPQYIQHL